jgi:hypothetical protein
MNNSELIQPHHRSRKAVIYIRQSSGHQVLTNIESGRMQRAMREHAQKLVRRFLSSSQVRQTSIRATSAGAASVLVNKCRVADPGRNLGNAVLASR